MWALSVGRPTNGRSGQERLASRSGPDRQEPSSRHGQSSAYATWYHRSSDGTVAPGQKDG
jgi:hypothetical protein